MISSTKNITKIDSVVLVSYILEKYGKMSHLKLQKLLYYIESYHLASFDDSIVEDEFEAWIHGPVSRKVYDTVKDLSILYGEIHYTQEEGEILPSVQLNEKLTGDQLQLIDDVLIELTPLSGFELENMTHSEFPWQYARKGYGPADRCNATIPKTIMHEFYKRRLLE